MIAGGNVWLLVIIGSYECLRVLRTKTSNELLRLKRGDRGGGEAVL